MATPTIACETANHCHCDYDYDCGCDCVVAFVVVVVIVIETCCCGDDSYCYGDDYCAHVMCCDGEAWW